MPFSGYITQLLKGGEVFAFRMQISILRIFLREPLCIKLSNSACSFDLSENQLKNTKFTFSLRFKSMSAFDPFLSVKIPPLALGPTAQDVGG